jgi:hypothetical protein
MSHAGTAAESADEAVTTPVGGAQVGQMASSRPVIDAKDHRLLPRRGSVGIVLAPRLSPEMAAR